MATLDVLSNTILNNDEKQKSNSTEDSTIPESDSRTNSIYQKCLICKKKVMSYSKCKCSNFYCGKHLHQHDCTFSHFLQNKINLEKKNAKIESEKITRI